MNNYVNAVIAADKECNEWICCNPKEKLRAIGTIFSKTSGPAENSTDVWPTKFTYKVVGHIQMFAYRIGKKGYYRKHEEIKCIDFEVLNNEPT